MPGTESLPEFRHTDRRGQEWWVVSVSAIPLPVGAGGNTTSECALDAAVAARGATDPFLTNEFNLDAIASTAVDPHPCWHHFDKSEMHRSAEFVCGLIARHQDLDPFAIEARARSHGLDPRGQAFDVARRRPDGVAFSRQTAYQRLASVVRGTLVTSVEVV